MAKFDFNNSRYARFFSDKENQRFLQSFLDQREIFGTNYGWYLTQGRIATDLTPTDRSGIASFNIKCRKLKAATMMDMRAPLGDSMQKDKGELKWYTATIPDFIAQGFVEKATEREYRMKQFEEFGNDKDLVVEWSFQVQDLIDSLDMTMNFLTARLMSTGKIDYTGIGMGIQAPIQDALIPDECKKKGGEKAWTDSDCNILKQMQKLESDYREYYGNYKGALTWQMTKKFFFDTFLENASIKELYVNWCKAHYVAYVDGMSVTHEQFLKALSDIQGVSPIEIVEEYEQYITNVKGKTTKVQAWSDDMVVLRPAGKVVEFERKAILDKRMVEMYGNENIKTVFGTTNNGLGLLVNTTLPNGRFKEWHTDLMLASVPALTDFLNHWIVDVSKAG